jgi:hypothetical protein
MPSETQQIAHLKYLLSDLGMTGRMTLDQAKAIREKRELKAELGNDIAYLLLLDGQRLTRT